MTAISWGALPRTGLLLEAHCGICGYTFRTVLPDQQTAAACGVDHRCGTGVVGPLWTLVQPPAVRRRARPSVENAA
jgi:hypothetical protein